MNDRIIRNDILKSKAITLMTVIFVAAAAMLVSLAAILGVNLFGAIDTLMSQSKTPHFMQMHAGELNMERLTAFADQNENVEDFQVLEFLGIEGSQMVFGENSLTDNVQDNGLSIQSEKFDFLLDLDGNIIQASDGEIYVPICYGKDQTAKVGDQAVINGKEFTVAGFLRDSQMNSTLSSSKRFLVSKSDYEELKSVGNMEYLIEFRLKDVSQLSAFETAYSEAGMEANGPMITYPLFQMINAISDGLMIGIILLVSVLVVAIAFMCIRFTLLAKMEDDYREIGVMRAIGLRVSDIKKIYLIKYVVIALTGSILGFALSFLFKGFLLTNIRLYMGESENDFAALLFGIIGILVVFFAIIAYVNGVLRRFRNISPAQAIRFGTSREKASGTHYFCLSKNRLLDTNLFLGVKDVLARKGIYGTMLCVLVLAAFIVIVPQNLYNTISGENFFTYMGIGKCDIRIDLQQTDQIPEKTADILETMKNDPDIHQYVLLTTKTFQMKLDNGQEERVKIELGDHTVFPVQYAKGRAPSADSEIALSVLNSEELGKTVGDVVTLIIDGKTKELTVCGLYSDITNGGKTAKAAFSDQSPDIMWSMFSAKLSNQADAAQKGSEYARKFAYAKVSEIDEYVNQTLGNLISSVGKASFAAMAASLFITALITLMFMKMLVAKDRYGIAVMKAVGFKNSDLIKQYISRSVFVLFIGIVLGTVLANTLGELIAGMAISSFGASSFQFVVNPFSAYLLCPLMMVCTVLIATIIGTRGAGKIKISENIKE